jgi:hypothetical protein
LDWPRSGFTKAGDENDAAIAATVMNTLGTVSRGIGALVEGGLAAIQDERVARVFVAAGTVVRQRRLGFDSNAPYSPTGQEVIEVLTTANDGQRRLLKEIAEGFTVEQVPVPPGSSRLQ